MSLGLTKLIEEWQDEFSEAEKIMRVSGISADVLQRARGDYISYKVKEWEQRRKTYTMYKEGAD